ncbi:MAG: archemetzincin [Bacteroidota bacterium]
MKRVRLLPLGGADPRLLEGLVPALRSVFNMEAVVGPCGLDLEEFYDEGRAQYHSTRILLRLKSGCPPSEEGSAADAIRLAVVPHDLYIPILTFVFGEAELGGTVAVVSYHRLQNERYGLAADPQLLRVRLAKEALHELGHTLGLVHCRTGACVMRPSSSVEEIDLKGEVLCRLCADAVGEGAPRGVVRPVRG